MSTSTSNISGNYRKIDVVGRGSFGSAILVQSVNDRKYYIMKVIDVSKMDRKQKEEALNEVTFLKAMRHPFIITYRESFMDKNRFLCIVMDYAEGGDMYTKIAKQKKLGKGFSENQILDWFVQTCLAMKYIHDRKILHRDLKTQNIFLTGKGEVKIGDFGIARVLQDTYDCAQTAIGTPYYLSPEICQEKPYNQKSDIWSLGCILYELATLRHAFDANSMRGLVLKILRGSYPAIPPNYSQDLKDLIGEMLSREPKNRPSIKKILEKPFLAGPLSNLWHNLANRESQRDVEKDLGDTIMKQINTSKDANPKNQLSSVISRAGQANPSSSLSQMKMSFLDKHSEGDYKKKPALMPQDENTSVNKSYSSQVGSSAKPQSNYQNFNQPPLKESPYPKSTIDNDVPSSEKRNSVYANRASVELPSRRDSYDSSRKPAEEESKFYHQSPLRKSSAKQPSHPVVYNPLLNKQIDKENNVSSVRESHSYVSESKEKKEEKDKINNLINDVKNVLYPINKSKAQPEESNSDDEGFEEDADKRVYAKFLTLDGKELPGVNEKDSICYRIEALRVYLENQIGEDPFCSSYRILTEQQKEEDTQDNVAKLLGPQKSKFLPLVYQMIVCEDEYYGNINNR